MTTTATPKNPFRPGAGQQPVFLAGRVNEQNEFRKHLQQSPILQNIVLTGLRGVGKTVLLEVLKPIAQSEGWLWATNDLSESISLTEERLARRIVVDLSTLTATLFVQKMPVPKVGFDQQPQVSDHPIGFNELWDVYEKAPGLAIDKLKHVLIEVWKLIEKTNIKGIVIAYDEAQNLADHSEEKEFPISLVIDLFSSLQRSTPCRYLLVLSGLPTLYPKLNEARTYTERMFHVMQLNRLSDDEAREAITRPIAIEKSPLKFSEDTIKTIVQKSAGYPYFIQFIAKEVFDAWIGRIHNGLAPSAPMNEILEKLDQDFFAGRWSRTTDRQRDFMKVIASLENSEEEFSVQEIVAASSKLLNKGFSSSQAQQILVVLAEKGLVYRTRRGGYSFAVPLLSKFILKQKWGEATLKEEV